eukprot:1492650-Alexandrium_andersonii.AAC.1
MCIRDRRAGDPEGPPRDGAAVRSRAQRCPRGRPEPVRRVDPLRPLPGACSVAPQARGQPVQGVSRARRSRPWADRLKSAVLAYA